MKKKKKTGSFKNVQHAAAKTDQSPQSSDKTENGVENKTLKKNWRGQQDTNTTDHHLPMEKDHIMIATNTFMSGKPACTNTMATMILNKMNLPQATARDHPDDQESLVTKNMDTEHQDIGGMKQIQKMKGQGLTTHPMPSWTNLIGINLKIKTTCIQESTGTHHGTSGLTQIDTNNRKTDHITEGSIRIPWIILARITHIQGIMEDIIITIIGTLKKNSTAIAEMTRTDTRQTIQCTDLESI